jgi:hypothetical protein
MTRKHAYYDDDWRSQHVDCPGCEWHGVPAEMDSTIYKELTEFSCPSCDKILLLVAHPTREEIERAARRGIKEAVQHLKLIHQVEGPD